MRINYVFIALLVFAILGGCQEAIVSTATVDSDQASSLAQAAKKGAQLGGMIWADGEVFETVGTPTSFEEGQGNFDRLFQGTFKDGIGAISESKPGDQDYNGGRWEVWQLKDGVTTNYTNADSVEDLNLDDFEVEGTYFECPLRPRRGKGHR
ncbi:MAG TPA: hypothetical protein VKP65_08535 [Rhodothermales bacterium]|nr:hypothetical protein [Rhodothermales bacterium]